MAEVLLGNGVGQNREPPVDVGEKISQRRAGTLLHSRQPLRFGQAQQETGRAAGC